MIQRMQGESVLQSKYYEINDSYKMITIYAMPRRFGFSEVTYYTLFKYSCNGDEVSLSECMLLSTVDCTTNDLASAVAVNCGEEGRANGENSQNTVQYYDIF